MPTRYPGNDEQRRALDAYIKLSRAAAAVDARINRPLAAAELTTSQFGVLEALHHLGPLTHGEIGRKLLKSSGNVTVVIDNLAKRGLVRRERDASDRRISRVTLTTAGSDVLTAELAQHVERVVAAFAPLDAAELDLLAALLKRLGLAAEVAAAGIAPTAPTTPTP